MIYVSCATEINNKSKRQNLYSDFSGIVGPTGPDK